MWSQRVFNRRVKLAQRFLHLSNAGIEAALSGPLHLAHVVEFPKCGGSWVRNMLRTYRDTDLFAHDRVLRHRDVIMVHRLYRRRFPRPIVVVRDPRDLYVSFYYYETAFERRDPSSVLFKYFHHDPQRLLQEDFHDYLRVKLLRLTHPWFFYSQFLDAWLKRAQVCVVRYEDCLAEPETQLIRMLRFLGDDIDLERVERTVQQTSFSAITQARYGQTRSPGEEDKTKFHRKGIAGDWRNHFNAASCRLLEKLEGTSLRRLGYEADAGWIERFLNDESSPALAVVRSA